MLNPHKIVNDDGDVLILPSLANYGDPNVTYNGNRIPSARLWNLAGMFLSHNKQPPPKLLFEEAKRAEIYRLIDSGQIVYTLNPRPTDRCIEGDVYARQEKQRVRVLVDHFGVKLGKIEGKLDKTSITKFCEVCANIGFFPVAYQENKIFFAANPSAVYDALGTTDAIRIAVFLKRPSSNHMTFDVNQTEKSSSISQVL